MSVELKPHGTDAAYQRHIKAGEQACDPCKEARRVYSANLRASSAHRREEDRKNTRAQNRAHRRLADLHRAEYERLLLEEKRKEWAS